MVSIKVGSGAPSGPLGPKINGAEHDAQRHQPGEDEVFADRIREEGHALFLEQRLILLIVGAFFHQLAGRRVFVDAFGQHQAQVKG